jgi:ABC-type transport system involved in Fe-S cluster assembly fused permease/ATPase subunit
MLIAYPQSTIQGADVIDCVANGKVIAQGRRAVLMAAKGR